MQRTVYKHAKQINEIKMLSTLKMFLALLVVE